MNQHHYSEQGQEILSEPLPQPEKEVPSCGFSLFPAATPTAPIQGCAVVVVERTARGQGAQCTGLCWAASGMPSPPAPCQCGRGIPHGWGLATALGRGLEYP